MLPAAERLDGAEKRCSEGILPADLCRMCEIGRLCGTLELPASVTAIEFGAFMGCDNLRYVLATGNKITTLGDNLFGEGVPSKLVYKK